MKRKVKRLFDIHIEVSELEKDMETLFHKVTTTQFKQLQVVALYLPQSSSEKLGTSIASQLPEHLLNMLAVRRENGQPARKTVM